MIDKINVRVYAAIMKDDNVLALREEYVGEQLLKFPGGGLEAGEGIIDCLRRELQEELNIELTNIQHLYTQEDFLVSKFRSNEQLLTIYYTAEATDWDDLLIMDPCIEKIEWISIQTADPFPLPIDKIAFEHLQRKMLQNIIK